MAKKTTNKVPRGKKGFVVAIDGPAGAGKSTVSRQLAEALGGVLLDTGAMYRGVAYFSICEGVTSAKALGEIARSLTFGIDEKSFALLLDGKDFGADLRTELVSEMASKISRYKSVRDTLTRRQRAIAKEYSQRLPVVVEGRDIGTVVFPKVHFKFYVTASAEVRAERRVQQLKKQGVKGTSLKAILKRNEARDKQDSTRKLAPLKCPDDAVVVDTSSMGISQVVRFMADHIRGRISLR